MDTDENVIEIKGMSFHHENSPLIFHDVTMNFARGNITAILGPSGSGKSTLLRLIGGQLKPTKGQINVFNQTIHDLPTSALYQLRKQMGMLFQAGGLFTDLSVYENVAFPLREHTTLPESMIHTLVLLKLELVGLRGARDLMPNELSGGMARRVALARAIALDPELILYDEPFTGQDPISMGVLIKLVTTFNKSLGATSVIVSHDVQETLEIADYVYVIVNQKIIAQGTPKEILSHHSESLQQFIKGSPDGPVPFHYPAKTMQEDFLMEQST